MRRRLFTVLSALSLLLCVAVCVLWVRSYSDGDLIEWVTWRWEETYRDKAAYGYGGPVFYSGAGGFEVSTERWVVTDKTEIELAREKPTWRRTRMGEWSYPPVTGTQRRPTSSTSRRGRNSTRSGWDTAIVSRSFGREARRRPQRWTAT